MIEKNDYLIMLIGSSPMPNLISAFTRIKENGKIFMIYTSETEKIAKQLEELIEKKSNDNFLNISVNLGYGKICEEYNLQKVSNYMENILKKIKSEYDNESLENKTIELNFTGGTKIMSSTAYRLFKEKFKKENAYLTYLDSEECEFIIYDIKKNKSKKMECSKKNETLDLNIGDIIDMHFEINENKFECERIKNSQISKVNEYIYDSLIENYDRKDEFIDLMEIIFSYNYKKNKNKIKDSISEINNKMENHSFKLNNINNYSKIISCYESEFGNLTENKLYEKIIEDTSGKWLEKIILKKLNNFKDEGYIDDVVISQKRENKKRKKDKEEFEVDIIILKNENLYCISVTTSNIYSEVNMKLHEIWYRGKSLGGDGVRLGIISFYDNKKALLEKIKNVWDEEKDIENKYLIITLENFIEMDELLRNWLK